jgi:hypothetical protein
MISQMSLRSFCVAFGSWVRSARDELNRKVEAHPEEGSVMTPWHNRRRLWSQTRGDLGSETRRGNPANFKRFEVRARPRRQSCRRL